MDKVIGYFICIVIIAVCINDSIQETRESEDIKDTSKRVLHYLSVAISLIAVSCNLDVIIDFSTNENSRHFLSDFIGSSILKYSSIIISLVVLKITIYLLAKGLIKFVKGKNRKRGKVDLIGYSVFLGFIKSLCIITIGFIGVIFINNFPRANLEIKSFNQLKMYNKLNDYINLDTEAVEILFNDDIWYEVSNLNFGYYNGVTLDYAVESNQEINQKAIELTSYKKNDIERARSLYVWIGSNIQYDFTKADNILSYDNSKSSGAIEAWNTRSGICFDYASLYVAMARASDIKVRLITGEAFDGVEYVSHAWNEVYIEDEGRWITVDPTFYASGDYFDSYNFNDTHIKEEIAGEW